MNDDPPDAESYGPRTALELGRLKREVARLGGAPMVGFTLRSLSGGPPLTVGSVDPGSEAALAGLRVDDELLSADDRLLSCASDVREALRARDRPVLLDVDRYEGAVELQLFVPRVPACLLTEEQLLSL